MPLDPFWLVWAGFPLVGVLILIKRPGNHVGLVQVLIGVKAASSDLASVLYELGAYPAGAALVNQLAFAPVFVLVPRNEPERESADIDLVAENVAFDQTELSASAGSITVSLENRDLFWHTFSIEELGVDLRVPDSAEMTVAFDALPGEYTFICDIPGHPEAGMKGTLLVDG